MHSGDGEKGSWDWIVPSFKTRGARRLKTYGGIFFLGELLFVWTTPSHSVRHFDTCGGDSVPSPCPDISFF